MNARIWRSLMILVVCLGLPAGYAFAQNRDQGQRLKIAASMKLASDRSTRKRVRPVCATSARKRVRDGTKGRKPDGAIATYLPVRLSRPPASKKSDGH